MEWQVVTVIIALVGLIGGITTPIIKLIGTITKLTVSVDNLKDDVSGWKDNVKEINEKNSESHRRLWGKNTEQDKTLENHDKRIEKLEEKK